MNENSIPMKPSTMGKEAWALGQRQRAAWKQHAFLIKMVTFQRMGSGTNVVNLEMIECPAFFEPAVVPENWEALKESCRLAGKDRVLKVISFPTFTTRLTFVLLLHNIPTGKQQPIEEARAQKTQHL